MQVDPARPSSRADTWPMEFVYGPMEIVYKFGGSKNGVFCVDVRHKVSTLKPGNGVDTLCRTSTRKPAFSVDLRHAILAENHAGRSQKPCRRSTSLPGAFSYKIKQNGAKIGPKWGPKACRRSTEKPGFSVDLRHAI